MKSGNLKGNLYNTKIVYNVGNEHISTTNAPITYNKLFEELDMDCIMLPVVCKQGELKEFMAACNTLGIRYICPTMPHKSDFVELLDDVDETSRLMHSVNAIRIDENGSHGTGTDGKGAVRAMEMGGAKFDGIRALMWGAGGIAGVTAYELWKKGVKKLYLANAFEDEAERMMDMLHKNTDMEVEFIGIDEEKLDKAAAECELCMNLTPLGSKGFPHKHSYLGFIEKLPKTALVFDSIINPPDTETLSAAKAAGLKTVPGLKMLCANMDLIFDFMWDKKLSDSDRSACEQALRAYLGLE